ncbi:MAG: TRAP transporter small permease subunit [Synergistales bacterium]|nr:TRAP transporter small permease subunit [Synergistales bacterium]
MKQRGFVLEILIPKFLEWMLVVTQLLLSFAIVATVLFRYILHLDLYGSEEFILIFAFWLYLMGAAYGSYEDSHIQADIVKEYVKNPRLRFWMRFVVVSISTVTCLVINYWAFNYFVWGIVRDTRSIAWRIPMVIPQSAILVGFSIMSLYLVLDLLRLIGRIRRGETTMETGGVS